MSPRHFSRLLASGYRQSEKEREFEKKVEHAISFAFSPVVHPVQTVSNLKRVFKRYRKQSES
jgi:hypothetical protein